MMGQSPRDLEHLADTWFIACRAGNLSLLVTLLFSGERFSNLSFLLHLPHPNPPRPEYLADPASAAEVAPLLGTSAASMTGLHLALAACFGNWDPEPFARHSPDTLRRQRKRLIMQLIEASTVSALECCFGEQNTALHLAAFLGDREIVEALLRKGVRSARAENGLKKTPWQVVTGPYSEELKEVLRREATAVSARTQTDVPRGAADTRITTTSDNGKTAADTGVTAEPVADGFAESKPVVTAPRGAVVRAMMPAPGTTLVSEIASSLPASLLSTKRALETSNPSIATSSRMNATSASISGRPCEESASAALSSPHSCERPSTSDESASKSLRLSPDDEDGYARPPQSRTALSSPLTRCLTVSEPVVAPLVVLCTSSESRDASAFGAGGGDQSGFCFDTVPLSAGKLVQQSTANVTPFQRLSISGQATSTESEVCLADAPDARMEDG